MTNALAIIAKNEGEKEMLSLTTHSTHFIYGYMASDMVKDHTDGKGGNPLQPHGQLHRFLFNGCLGLVKSLLNVKQWKYNTLSQVLVATVALITIVDNKFKRL